MTPDEADNNVGVAKISNNKKFLNAQQSQVNSKSNSNKGSTRPCCILQWH